MNCLCPQWTEACEWHGANAEPPAPAVCPACEGTGREAEKAAAGLTIDQAAGCTQIEVKASSTGTLYAICSDHDLMDADQCGVRWPRIDLGGACLFCLIAEQRAGVERQEAERDGWRESTITGNGTAARLRGAGRVVLKNHDALGCPIPECDKGAIPHGPDPDGHWEAEQCQYCAEMDDLRAALKSKGEGCTCFTNKMTQCPKCKAEADLDSEGDDD